MRLTANEKITINSTDKMYFNIPIGEFPCVGEYVRDRNGAAVYTVPEGVTIASYDHTTGEVCQLPITHFTVEENCPCVTVETARKREVRISDNESLAVFNPKTGELEKWKPKDAVGKLVPVVWKEPIVGNKFNRDIGWWYAALAADGWVRDRMVGYAKNDITRLDEFERIARSINPNFSKNYYADTATATNGKFSDSQKIHLNGVQLAESIYYPYCVPAADRDGRGALYKMIPAEIMHGGNRECLLGVLSGLLDGDKCVGWNGALKKRRAVCRFNTSSKAFRDSIIQVCRYLGIRCAYTTVPARNNSQESYVVLPSLLDLQKIAPELTPVSRETQAWIEEFINAPLGIDQRNLKPITRALALAAAQELLAMKKMTLYSACRKAAVDGYMNAHSAEQVIAAVAARMADDPEWEKFVMWARNTEILWEVVAAVTPCGNRKVFDLAIPGTKVFMIANGLIVWDTMQFHVPSTDDAAQELAEKLLPSRNLLSTGTFKVHQLPGKEYVAGLYNATAEPDEHKPPVVFNTPDEALRAYKEGRISINRRVHILNMPQS